MHGQIEIRSENGNAVSMAPDEPPSTHPLSAIRAAHAARDWEGVLGEARTYRHSFPPSPEVDRKAISALRALRRFDEAATAIELARRQYGPNLWLGVERAQLYLSSGNTLGAVEEAATLREQFPRSVDGYWIGIHALRLLRQFENATRLVETATQLFPHVKWFREERIRLLENQRQWESVVTEAEALIGLGGEANPFVYRAALRALRLLNRSSDAEILLGRATEHADLDPWIYLEGAENSQAKLDFETADRWLIAGTDRYPRDRELALAYAVRPGRDPTERKRGGGDMRSIERLERLLVRFPDDPEAVAALAEGLLNGQQGKQAETLLAASVELARTHTPIAMLWARAALFLDESDEAIRRYRLVVEWFPDFHLGYQGLVTTLSRRGDHEEAESICKRAINRFPLSVPILGAWARIAEDAGDLREAIKRLESLDRDFPGLQSVQQRIYSLQLKLQDEVFGSQAETGPVTGSTAGTDPKAIMMQCQSLGGTGIGCEFGMVQRHFGVEPLSFLRWTSFPHQPLVRAIELGFEGVELDENIDIELAVAGNDLEYILRSSKFKFGAHTFIYTSEVSEQKFRAQMYRRLKFLRQIFLDDLRSSRQLFVRKQETPVTAAESIALYEAMSKYGDNTVLYVYPCNADHPAGTVEEFRPGLLFGYLDYFKRPGAGEDAAMINMDCWLKICTRAHAIWRASRSESATA